MVLCCIITCRTLLARLFCFVALAGCVAFIVVGMVFVWACSVVFIALLVVGGYVVCRFDLVYWWVWVCIWHDLEVQKWGPEIVKNGSRVWAFCKIEFPGIQKPVQIFDQKAAFFKKCGNRGVGVIWLVRRVGLIILWLCGFVVRLVVGVCLFGVMFRLLFFFWMAGVFSGCKMKHGLVIYLL